MQRLFFFILIHLVIGCSTFTSYPKVTQEARWAFENGDFATSLELYQEEGLDDPESLDSLCYMLECGLVSHTAGDYKKSIRFFSDGEKRIEHFRKKAKISASDIGEQASSLLINDKTISYQGEHFERTLLHTYQALNYLFLGKLEGARVEIKRAELSQKEAEKAHQDDLEQAKKDRKAHYNKYVGKLERAFREEYSQYPDKYLHDTSNIYQLGCTFYLGSLIYELLGEYNDSYIDLKKLYQINPAFGYGVLDMYYKAKKAGFAVEAGKWAKKLPQKIPTLDPDMGSVVVFFQCDRGPFKREAFFVIPTLIGFQKVAWPMYIPGREVANHIGLKIGKKFYTSEPLVDLNSVAIRYHKNRTTTRLVRMAIRLATKISAQVAAYESVRRGADSSLAGLGASLLTSAITSFTEQADERCWMTLPRSIHFLRAYMPAGKYNAKLLLKDFSGWNLNNAGLGQITVAPGKITFITVRSIGSKLFWDIKQPRLRIHLSDKRYAPPNE